MRLYNVNVITNFGSKSFVVTARTKRCAEIEANFLARGCGFMKRGDSFWTRATIKKNQHQKTI